MLQQVEGRIADKKLRCSIEQTGDHVRLPFISYPSRQDGLLSAEMK